MIQWGEPLWLIGLVLPLLLVLGEWLSKGYRESLRRRFASRDLWPRLAPGSSPTLRRTHRYLFAIALLFLILGLANPRIGTRYEEVTRQGVDIVLVVDVSRSMDSQDIRPSRLTKTKYELARFIEGMKGDRVGIVPFSGTAYPLLPLTLDYSAARMFLDLLSSDLVPNPGTNIESAIDVALAMYGADDDSRGRVIVLISDGEDHEGGALRAADRAARADVAIHSIGMALAKGDPVPTYDQQGNRTGWLTDDRGEIVTSRLNEELLRNITSRSGGSYRRSDQGGDAFRRLYAELFQLEKKEFEARRITGHEDRFQPLLLIALLLLLTQFALPEGRSTNQKRHGWQLLLLFPFLLLLPAVANAENPHELVKKGNNAVIEKQLDEALTRYLEAKAAVDSSRPEIDYNLGGVYARKGDVARADSLFNSLPDDAHRSLRSRAAYNRGTTFAQAQAYDKAVESFIDALKLDPTDQDAKRNLELALRMLQQQEQNQENDGDQGDENQDQQPQPDQQQQDDEQQDNEQQQQQEQQQEEEQEQQQPHPTQEEMDRELAERLLDQLQQDEKELLKEVVRQQIPQQSKSTVKPW